MIRLNLRSLWDGLAGKVLAPKPEDMNLILGAHVVQRAN